MPGRAQDRISVISRRRLLASLPPLATAALFAVPSAHAATFTDATKYPSLQAAIDATPDGGTVASNSPTTKFTSATLRGRKNVTLTGLSIAGSVTLAGCTGCIINNCTLTGVDGTAVFLIQCSGCTVSKCRITGSRIAAYSPVNCTFSENTITNSVTNGIGVAGYPNAPATGNKYLKNIINASKRIGIEEYPTDGDVSTCRGSVFDSNRIFSPVAMGISAMGLDPKIVNNTIQNAGWTAVEITGSKAQVSNNAISHDKAAGTGIMVNGTGPALVGATTSIAGNRISGHAVGISLISNKSTAPLRNVTVNENTVSNCADFGILASPAYSGEGLSVNRNEIALNVPTISGRVRVALKTGTGLSLDGNRITYGAGSTGPAVDMPIHLIGNNVTLANTTVDGGGRSAASNLNPSASIAPAGTFSGWQYLTNRHLNGAKINKSGTKFIVDTDLL